MFFRFLPLTPFGALQLLGKPGFLRFDFALYRFPVFDDGLEREIIPQSRQGQSQHNAADEKNAYDLRCTAQGVEECIQIERQRQFVAVFDEQNPDPV